MTRWLGHPLTGPVAATIVVALLVLATTDRFLAVGNLNNLALQVSIVALVAIGSTIVIIVGGIDLSPGSMIALLTMLLASMLKFWGVAFWPAIVLTLVAGAILGSVNGFVTAYLRIPSFIATLAALSAYRGIAFMFNKGSPVFDASDRLEPLFYGHLFGIPLPFFYIIVFFAGGALADAAYETGPLHLCGRWQRQCGAPFRHQRAPHAIPRFCHSRLHGCRRRRADGRAAQLRFT